MPTSVCNLVLEVPVEKAKQLLSEARVLIEKARSSLAEAKNSVADVLSGENPKEVFEKARESVKLVVSHVKEAHRALVQSIVALKGEAPEPKIEAGGNDEESVTNTQE